VNLTTIATPAGVQQVVATALYHANTKKMASAAGGAPPAAVSPSMPHVVYTLGLSDLAGGSHLTAAVPSGTGILLTDGNSVVGSIRMSATVGAPPTFQGLSHEGPLVQGIADAVHTAESAQAGKSATYEIRVLQIPALCLLALWLHGVADNLFVPISPAPKPLLASQVYNEAQFFQPLQVMANARQGFNNAPKGSLGQIP
jgi:hypothetical protein